MRYFLLTAIGTVFFLVLYFSYQQYVSDDSLLPFDYEQTGLNDQIIIKFSHVVAENTPKGMAASKFAQLVEEKTNEQIKVEVYPNSMLYSDDDELRALVNNDIQMIAPAISNVTHIVPEWQVLDLPYLFTDYNDIHTIFTGNIAKKLLTYLDREEIKGLALWSNGFKQMTSSTHAIKNIEDFKGLTVRTMSSKLLQQQFSLLGATTKEISFAQVYSFLEQEKVEAQENTLSNIYSKGFYKVQNHLTISNHGFLGYAVMMNEEFWNSLPIDLQKKVEEAVQEATLWNLQQSEQMNKESLEKIKKSSNIQIYNLNQQEKIKWASTLHPLYQTYQTDIESTLIHDIKEKLK